jgi:hypothetical protein
MNKVEIKDGIRIGEIKYRVGDSVVLIRRKKNGYPRSLEDNTVYKIDSIENDNIIIKKPNDGINLTKVHQSYLLPLTYFRNVIIEKILEEN